jgi:hypothetical protein
MPLNQGYQGQTGKAVGQNVVAGFGEFSDQLFTELMPRYYENAYRGNVFFAANQAAATFAANGLTTSSAVGLCVYNPPTSSKNIVPLQLEVSMTNLVTSSTAVQVIAVVSTSYSALTPATNTAITPVCTKGPGVSTSVAICAQSLTFANNTTIWKTIYNAYVTTTIAAAIPTQNYNAIDIGGTLIIPPGAGMALICNNASTGIASATWAEIAL